MDTRDIALLARIIKLVLDVIVDCNRVVYIDDKDTSKATLQSMVTYIDSQGHFNYSNLLYDYFRLQRRTDLGVLSQI